jgi:DNA polymerase III epsilon subunit-like protein
MDYIVMDLEWNQNPYGKDHIHSDITFEIIEIGAVKVNEDREIEDRYQQIIKPRIFKKLHYKIKEITQFTPEELNKGKDFRRAIVEFLEWCGDDYIFCTWGSMDLAELQKNMKHYGMERILDFPLFYIDLQKMFSLRYDDGHIKRTLSHAVEYLNIEETIPFHRALSDAYYTARVMKEMDFEKYKDRLSIDTFYSPRIKEEEVFVRFDTYTKYISREFLSKEEMFEEKDVSEMRCNICDKMLKPKLKWFSDGGRMYYCLGECEEHGYVRGKIKIKKVDDEAFFVIKIMKSTDEEGANSIYEKQDAIREKRRERRQKMLDHEIVIDEIWDEENNDDED